MMLVVPNSRSYEKYSRSYEKVSRSYENFSRYYEKYSRYYENFSRYYENISRFYEKKNFFLLLFLTLVGFRTKPYFWYKSINLKHYKHFTIIAFNKTLKQLASRASDSNVA